MTYPEEITFVDSKVTDFILAIATTIFAGLGLYQTVMDNGQQNWVWTIVAAIAAFWFIYNVFNRKTKEIYTFFFFVVRTSKFQMSLDVLIFPIIFQPQMFLNKRRYNTMNTTD